MPGLTVFVRQRDSAGNLGGILVHDSRDPKQPVTMMAQQGQLQQTPKGPRFLLLNGNRQEMDNGRLSLLKFDRYAIDLSFYTKQVDDREVKPDEMSLVGLLKTARTNPELHDQMLAEASHRLVWPFYNFALPLFAVVMLLNGEFNRRGNGRRITLAVASALILVALGLSLQNVAAHKPAALPAIYLTVVAVFAFCLWKMSERPARPIPPNPPAGMENKGEPA